MLAELDTSWLLLMLTGAVIGGGILLFVVGATPREAPTAVSSSVDFREVLFRFGRRLPAGIAAALVLLLVTRWIALAVAGGLLVFFWSSLVGGAGAERAAYVRLEALAAWTESLRDTIAGAVGLEQAIPATAEAAGPAIQGPLQNLSDRLRVRQPLPVALQRFAADLDDPAADLIVAALVLNARLRGPGLRDVLTSLSRSVRQELEMRGRVTAGRSATRRSVQIVVGISAFSMVGLRIANPSYVEPFSSASGQLVLVMVLVFYAAGFFWLRRLASFTAPRRFLFVSEENAVQVRSTRPRAGLAPGAREPEPAGQEERA